MKTKWIIITGIVLIAIGIAWLIGSEFYKGTSGFFSKYTESESETKSGIERPLFDSFEVPAGNGKNIESNTYHTGLLMKENDLIRYRIKEGGPLFIKIGEKEKDKIEISSGYVTKALKEADNKEIALLRWKPTKLEIRIIPSKSDSS